MRLPRKPDGSINVEALEHEWADGTGWGMYSATHPAGHIPGETKAEYFFRVGYEEGLRRATPVTGH